MTAIPASPVIIPADILESTGKDDKAFRLDLAIFFYKEFNLSAGRASNFAGISRIAFWNELGKRKISINYATADALHDINAIQQFDDKFPLTKLHDS